MTRFFKSLLIIGAGFQLASCKPTPTSPQTAEVKRFQQYNIRNDFGLCPGELALTIDDGPYDDTYEMAKFLARNNVPATFFMTGKQMSNPKFKDMPRQILQLKLPNGEYAHNLGNHSYSHELRTRIEDAQVIAREIVDTNNIIQEAVRSAGIPNDNRFHRFYRAPFGSYSGKDVAVFLNGYITNEGRKDLAELVGPVFWHTGGGQVADNGFGADWDCWGKGVSTEECAQRYLNEIEYRRNNGQIVLTHDVRRQSYDFLRGPNGIIKKAKQHGYKWVRLDKHKDRIKIMAESTDYEGGPAFPAVNCAPSNVKLGLTKKIEREEEKKRTFMGIEF
jgi:peptidoglycan/xylan/chitin deacetylase (PgdA/CDA1 family)